MITQHLKKSLRFFSMIGLACAAGLAAHAQGTTVALTAQRMSLQLPDGNKAQMWGFCTTGSCTTSWAQGPTLSVAVGQTLTINLTNSLPTPTSIVILGQNGGGAGTQSGGVGTPSFVDSPKHAPQTVTTWPAKGTGTFTPPQDQAQRVQSFGTETKASGGTNTYTWTPTKAGTYLYETGTNPSIQAPMGLYGVVVVTNTPQTTATTGTGNFAYPGAYQNVPALQDVNYDYDAVMLLSEIDLVQNNAVDAAASSSSYPPAVNYAPTYFLMNGQPFNRANPISLPIGAAASVNGNVLLRFANAGLRTHIPSVIGLDMKLVAEDGNILPGNPRVQNEVLLPAGKTYDVVVNPPTTTGSNNVKTFNANAYGIFDRELALSAGNTPDSGIQTFLQVSGASLPAGARPTAVADMFSVPSNATSYTGNVLINDIAIYGATIPAGFGPAVGTVALSVDGSFVFTPPATPGPTVFPVTFTYCGNGAVDPTVTPTLCAAVTLNSGNADVAPTAVADNYTSQVSTYLRVPAPGVLANDIEPSNFKLTAIADPKNPLPAGVTLNKDGSFTAAGGVTSFQYVAQNSQGVQTASTTVSITYLAASKLQVSVTDPNDPKATIADYGWTIEEDTTYKNDAATNTVAGPPNTLAVNFHKSYMPVVATGCTGPISCGQGQQYSGAPAPLLPMVSPGDVHLDPSKHYYISVLPGDAANAFINANNNAPSAATCTKLDSNNQPINTCGHTIGGATFDPGQASVTVLVEPNPLPTAQLSVFIFEDNNPTNGDIDGPEESQGLGGFEIIINDVAGRTGDPAGQMTYDAFNMPLTNSLMGTPDCPAPASSVATPGNLNHVPDPTLQGRVFTCPAGSRLAGHALIKNLMPGRFDVLANPGGAREAAGEHWVQTSTLEGTRAQDAFTGVGEPAYFQEFGPPGFHSFIGFVNPDKLEARHKALGGTNSIAGHVANEHMSRPVNETLYTGSHAPLSQSTCYVGLNSQTGNGENIAFSKCDKDGNFTISNVPDGSYQVVIWDEWLDQIIGYQNQAVPDATGKKSVNMGEIQTFSWFTRLETNTFLDNDGTHKPSKMNDGISQVPFTIRFRDGSFSNILKTDSSGNATFNELFPLFNWYVIESDTTRYKGGNVNVVVDGGGQPDTTGDYAGILNSTYPTGETTVKDYPGSPLTLGLQGFISQTAITNWAKVPYAQGENGGINGTVVYSSTRPFDDPRLLFQNLWEPLVPGVTVNLYQQTTAPDGTAGLQYIESTTTSSWDLSTANMHCPGQLSNDPFVPAALGTQVDKCYDGFHNWNQVQPAAYDGRYNFTRDQNGAALKPGTYVVEVVLPQGYELVKEEDKNILIGDAFILSSSQQFGGLGNIFILPDQATVNEYDLGHPTDNLQYPACVGDDHLVPDFLSLFPGSGQVAPFAGATRKLCNRKLVILNDQMQANADFFVFTPTPIASHFTGIILDDASAEFNTASPDFGEKASVPFVPVSIRDWKGNEISRLHSDQYGTFNGLTPSSWEVNVPNPAGYSPNMLTTCMNDPGPITVNNVLVTDPSYNPNYSIFCYDNPFMPGLTDYLDTPLLPVSAFAAGYNPADCAYPDTTPAIRRVDTSAGHGPWLLPTGPNRTVTLTSVGIATVPNPDYAGPSANTSPANQKTITRNFGFGTAPGQVLLTMPGVSVPLSLPVTSWSDGSITVSVPSNAATGQLTVVAANGKSSIDGITLNIEIATPTRISPSPAGGDLQKALDGAAPGSLIILEAGTYNELAIMSTPVRIQGVGAASVIINATKYPTSKLENWRPRINTLFGIDDAGNQTMPAFVDPLPGEEITGGVVLLEPSVLGTEEGAGITVLAKNLGAQIAPRRTNCSTSVGGTTVYNFACYPSRIDGVSVTGGDSGGGIFVHGYAHNIEISNNRVYGNAGAYNGGVRIGVPYLEGLAFSRATRAFAFNNNVNIHNNSITSNGTVEANTGAGGAGGGLSLDTGTDNYKVTSNFVCGNFSTGDGGGIGHIGLSLNGLISKNIVQFNQSYAQGATVHGGGIIIEGEPAAAGGALSLGSGSVKVDSNLIQGNFAEVGNGGGIRLQNVNGAEIAANVDLYEIDVTNNIITNNVAGTAGGGIALVDTVNAKIYNNTIANNDSVSIAGADFTVAPLISAPHVAGVASETNSTALKNLLSNSRRDVAANNHIFSNPVLNNNIIWHNRSFYFDGTKISPTTNMPIDQTCSSNQVPSATSNCTPAPVQATSGQCNDTPTGAPAYWDLGLMNDPSATPTANHLSVTNSILSKTATAYTGPGNQFTDPLLAGGYCNGGRGKPDALHIFQLAASAVEDEGGNFVDLRYGPLTPTGDYHITATSPAIDTANNNAPAFDFFGTKRPQGPRFDIGAHEFAVAPQLASLTPSSLDFGNVQLGQTSATLVATLANIGTVPLTVNSIANPILQFSQTNNCGNSVAVGASCTINIVFKPTLIAGGRNTTLNVNDGAGTQTVNLTANATAPSATLIPGSLAFGTLKSGMTSAAKMVVMKNTGAAPIPSTVNFVTGFFQTPTTQYKLTTGPNACGNTLAANSSCNFYVVFAPTSTGSKPATMNVNDGVGFLGLPQTVGLTGTGN